MKDTEKRTLNELLSFDDRKETLSEGKEKIIRARTDR